MELEHEADVLVAERTEGIAAQPGDLFTIDDQRAAIGFFQGAQYLQQGGLARAAGANDTHHLTLPHMEVDSLQHMQVAESFADTGGADHGDKGACWRRILQPFRSAMERMAMRTSSAAGLSKTSMWKKVFTASRWSKMSAMVPSYSVQPVLLAKQ